MTKKCLVAFDPDKPQSKSSDFLCPIDDKGGVCFLGLKTNKIHTMGLVIFTGKDLSPNDLFARLVETGRKIDSVDGTFKNIVEYLESLILQRIGDVCTIVRKDSRVVLVQTDCRSPSKRVPLP